VPFGERHPLAPRLPNGASQLPGTLSSSTTQLKAQVSAAVQAPSASGSGGGSGNLLLKTLHKPAEAARAEGSQSQTLEFGKHSTSSTPSQVQSYCCMVGSCLLLLEPLPDVCHVGRIKATRQLTPCAYMCR
jgi:hypothetical protein